MKVFRVHSVVIYPDGHPVKEAMKARSGEYYRPSEHKVTTWDVTLADGAEEACQKVRRHHEANDTVVRSIWSVNHIGDITIP